MARSFDGNDKLQVLSAVVSAPPFTIACWCKRSAATATTHSLAGVYTDGSTANLHRLTLSPAHLLQAQTNEAGSTSNSTGHTFNDTAAYHHIAGVWASTTSRRCYLDGTGDTANTTSRNPTVDCVKIGARGTDSQFLTNALLGYVAIWNIALSDAEITGLAGGDHPQAVQGANLVAWWLPDEDDITDQVGSADLTNTGSTYSTDNPTVDDPPAAGDVITVDSGSLALEGQNVGTLFTAAYVIPVEHGQAALEGQQIPFIITQPYTDAELVLEGQDITLTAQSVISVDAGQMAMQGQTVAMPIRMAVTHGELALRSGTVLFPWSEAPDGEMRKGRMSSFTIGFRL